MAFELPTLPFPKIPGTTVPYIASPDSSGLYTVPSSQWFKGASGLWVPVDATNPLPTMESELQNRIGEVQDNPATNTVLARLKALEDKIDSITSGTTPAKTELTGSNMELYGKTLDDMPAANTVKPGTTFTIVDDKLDQNWISDGTDWLEV